MPPQADTPPSQFPEPSGSGWPTAADEPEGTIFVGHVCDYKVAMVFKIVEGAACRLLVDPVQWAVPLDPRRVFVIDKLAVE